MDTLTAEAVGRYLEACCILSEGAHVLIRHWQLYDPQPPGNLRWEWWVNVRLHSGASLHVRKSSLLAALEEAVTRLHGQERHS